MLEGYLYKLQATSTNVQTTSYKCKYYDDVVALYELMSLA